MPEWSRCRDGITGPANCQSASSPATTEKDPDSPSTCMNDAPCQSARCCLPSLAVTVWEGKGHGRAGEMCFSVHQHPIRTFPCHSLDVAQERRCGGQQEVSSSGRGYVVVRVQRCCDVMAKAVPLFQSFFCRSVVRKRYARKQKSRR